jgi:glycosyltransferase involved in cell wall biosynthesis
MSGDSGRAGVEARAGESGVDERPVLFVTNYAPAFRIGAFARLHEREGMVFALVGGRLRHGGAGPGEALSFPVLRPPQRAVGRLAASGRFRAVVAGLSGRVALPAAYAGARAAGVPFVLWATIWRHPRTPAHALSYLPLRRLYRDADAIATYGPHVSRYVRAKGARGAVVEAPQSVDGPFWAGPAEPRRHAAFQVLFAGRLAREKGVGQLLEAWRLAALPADRAALVMAGAGALRAHAAAAGAVLAPGPLGPTDVRELYAGSDVVVVPSVPTRDFLEPWGLVVNEAFHRGVPVVATTAVGAVAGGLVRHERTGLVVPSGDPHALAAGLRRLHADAGLRARLGAAAREAVAAYSHDAWAEGMGRALAAAGAARRSRERSCRPLRDGL